MHVQVITPFPNCMANCNYYILITNYMVCFLLEGQCYSKSLEIIVSLDKLTKNALMKRTVITNAIDINVQSTKSKKK